MRKLLLTLWGVLSTIVGLLIVMPRIHLRTWMAQMVLHEISPLAALVALRGTWLSLRYRSTVGAAYGALGALLAAVPLLRVRNGVENMDRMMQQALGADYEGEIPTEALRHCAPKRLSLRAAVGSRYRVQDVKTTCDIEYHTTPHRTLRLDIHQPQQQPVIGDRYPAVIALHPGGWHSGDKGWYFTPHHRYLASLGYVVFDAQYRFTNEAPWSAQLDDARAAVRWVKAHADTYNIDPERIALFGRSAGGHIALNAAYRACDEHEDTRVKAVLSAYAPIDLRMTGPEHDPRVLALLGGASYEVPERYADANPLNFIRDGLPPTLLIHGKKDGLVSITNSEMLRNRLLGTDTPVVLLRVPWSEHSFDLLMFGMGGQIVQYYIDRFLAWSLYR